MKSRFTRGDIPYLVVIGLVVAYFAGHIAYAALSGSIP